MKRIGNVFEEIVCYDNLVLAHHRARKGKSHYRGVKHVNANEEKVLKALQSQLINKTFTTSKYRVKRINDNGKERDIYILPYYPDRIVQHAILNIIEDRLTKSLIRDTFQSIKGRGIHDARKRVRACLKKEDALWSMKLDVEKYYPSINNNIMKSIVSSFIKCRDTLWLLFDIIDSIRGLPIGNHISQILGNLYLSAIDWFVKQELKPVGYFRYCDDLILIDKSYQNLKTFKQKIEEKLSNLCLKLKTKVIISKIQNTGLDFVGFLYRKNSTTLRKRVAKAFKDKVSKKRYLSILSYKGNCKYVNAKKLWYKYAKPVSHKLGGSIKI